MWDTGFAAGICDLRGDHDGGRGAGPHAGDQHLRAAGRRLEAGAPPRQPLPPRAQPRWPWHHADIVDRVQSADPAVFRLAAALQALCPCVWALPSRRHFPRQQGCTSLRVLYGYFEEHCSDEKSVSDEKRVRQYESTMALTKCHLYVCLREISMTHARET